jgi:hypothetical protein
MCYTGQLTFVFPFVSKGVYMTSVLEELHWTLLIIGHFLCDPFKGQIPKVPQTLSLFSVEIAKMKSTNVTTVQVKYHILNPHLWMS